MVGVWFHSLCALAPWTPSFEPNDVVQGVALTDSQPGITPFPKNSTRPTKSSSITAPSIGLRSVKEQLTPVRPVARADYNAFRQVVLQV